MQGRWVFSCQPVCVGCAIDHVSLPAVVNFSKKIRNNFGVPPSLIDLAAACVITSPSWLWLHCPKFVAVDLFRLRV